MKRADAFLPLHPLELRILLVLLDRPAHGYEIVGSIEAEFGSGPIYPANLYRRIRDLLNSELLEETDPPAGEAVDRRRRYLGVTALGREVARQEALRLQRVVQDPMVKRLLQATR